jgi:Peptidase C65 Otubain
MIVSTEARMAGQVVLQPLVDCLMELPPATQLQCEYYDPVGGQQCGRPVLKREAVITCTNHAHVACRQHVFPLNEVELLPREYATDVYRRIQESLGGHFFEDADLRTRMLAGYNAWGRATTAAAKEEVALSFLTSPCLLCTTCNARGTRDRDQDHATFEFFTRQLRQVQAAPTMAIPLFCPETGEWENLELAVAEPDLRRLKCMVLVRTGQFLERLRAADYDSSDVVLHVLHDNGWSFEITQEPSATTVALASLDLSKLITVRRDRHGRPFLGPKELMATFEMSEPHFFALRQEYRGIRRIRGDGNGYYRALLYAYCEDRSDRLIYECVRIQYLLTRAAWM